MVTISTLASINFWSAPPRLEGYVARGLFPLLIHSVGTPGVKVLSGQRRTGKSTLLKQLIGVLIQDFHVLPSHILYLNFELRELQSIQNSAHLFQALDLFLDQLQRKGPVKILLDEIQDVTGWEKVIRSYLAKGDNIEFFITGSNSKLLSSELGTYLTGRYLEIEVSPFSYAEFLAYHQLERSKASFLKYLGLSGLPELYQLSTDELKMHYLDALRSNILLKDIVQRYRLKSPEFLDVLFSFLTDNIGNLFSLNSIAKKFKSTGVSTTTMSVAAYVRHLESAFLIHGVSPYDIRGKRIIESEKKYYLNDLGFKTLLGSPFDPGMSKNLENVMFMMLKQKGYTVSFGRIQNLEVDFVAQQNKDTQYVQICYLLSDEKTVNREYQSLQKIHDHWPKWVISLDEIGIPPKEGIRHVSAWEADLVF